MANKIRLNRVNGSDNISNSAETLNQNFNLIEDFFETQLGEGISSLDVDEIRWTTSPSVGPSSQISLSTGKVAKINPIPSADRSQSGVITTTNQEFGGIKSFKDGISTNSITDYSGHRVVTSGGSTVYIGGENGIRLVYNGNELTDVVYPFSNGTDLSEVISTITSQTNSLSGDMDDMSEEMRRRLEQLMSQYNDLFEEQEGRITNISEALSQINLEDLMNQTDGMIENWFGHEYEMEPLMNSWATNEEKDRHLGDTFTDIDNLVCYKFVKNGSTYYWRLIDESEYPAAVMALINSLDAMSIADGKCTTFYQSEIPAPCYTGDIWIPTQSFYMNGNVQVPYVETDDEGSDGPLVYYRNSILFCIRDNITEVGDINDWCKDLSTWSEIQFQKNVEKKFEDTQLAIEKAQQDIDAINDDNIFSVFEKMDFLNNTWYKIAGSYVYDLSNDITYNDGVPESIPPVGLLGTTEHGTFWDCVRLCIGDNDDFEIYASTLGELISAFKNLAGFCVRNGLFETPLESTEFFTIRSHTDENLGQVAKQELADLLYNYYREEEECKKTSYVNAMATTVEELFGQNDHIIQNWFMNGVPTLQAQLPWNEDAGESEYNENDLDHVGDTLVDLTPNIGQNVYKFTPGTATGENDVQVTDISYYWKSIKSSDLSAIIEELGIDENLASGDGSVKVFNTLPHDYTYGDIWFCSGFTPDEQSYMVNNGFDMNAFTTGCIYYCNNTELTGLEGHIRENFIPADWKNGYEQGDDFVAMFTAMASDSMLTPVEKNQLVRKWYEIASTDLYGNDNDSLDNIVQDIIEDDESNEGSFRFVLRECYKAIKNEEPTNDWADFYNFIYVDYENPNTDEYEIIEIIKSLIVKLKDIDNGLILCGCGNEEISDIKDLTEISFTGFASPSNLQYNGIWIQSKHVSMLANLFTTYYMEEDNLKTVLQQYKLDRIEASIEDILTASSAIINVINNDNEFSVSEKRTFLNNVWYRIAGSRTYDPTKNTGYINSTTGKPQVGYLGTGTTGTFWSYIKDMSLTTEPQIVTRFEALGNLCKNTFGLFANPLTASTFEQLGGVGTIDNLYDALYAYLNEEEALRISSYQNQINSAVAQLSEQLDGQVTTWYYDTNPPSDINQMPWRVRFEDTNDENHINDIYKNYSSGVAYLFKSTSGATIGESDIQVTGNPYYWKVVETGELASTVAALMEQLQGYESDLAHLDGFIQIFGPQQLPAAYSYGDIWFFGGVEKIEDDLTPEIKSQLSDESKWVPGNIYYCDTDPDDPLNIDFEDVDWTLGSAATMLLYNRLNHMTSDNWLSASEKSVLLNEWYKIAGVSFNPASSINTILTNIESSASNTGSYFNVYKRFSELGNYEGSGLNEIHKAFKDIYVLLKSCNCNVNEDTNLESVEFPTFNNNYGNHDCISEVATIISDVFNRYYTEEENLKAEIEEYSLSNLQNSLQIYINNITEQLREQIDGIVTRWRGERPPAKQAEFPWREENEDSSDYDTKDEEHVGDEFNAFDGKVYLFMLNDGNNTPDTSAGDIETDTNYYWKIVDAGSIQELINQIEGYYQSLADSDGNIQVFGPKKLPVNYNYGDIWFFGGTSEIVDYGGQNQFTVNASLLSWLAGNIYYCKDYASQYVFTNFSASNWAVGSNAGQLTNQFTQLADILKHITDDGWLSVLEKKTLFEEWYSITGIEIPPSPIEDYNSLVSTFSGSGSYKTLIDRIPNSASEDSSINNAKTNLKNKIIDIYKMLVACECYGEYIDTDTDLTTVKPSDLNLSESYSYVDDSLNENPMMLTKMFSKYYACESILEELIVNFNVSSNVPSLQSLTNDIQSRGLDITSAIQLMYSDKVTGGLNGRDTVEIEGNQKTDNVGLWFGGEYEDAWKTVNDPYSGNLPVVITKNGLGSRIGPMFIKDSEYMYIKNPTNHKDNRITLLGTNQISLGMTEPEFDEILLEVEKPKIPEAIKGKSTIYLDRNGTNSKIGPFEINANGNIEIGNHIFFDQHGYGSRIGQLQIDENYIHIGENSGNVTVIGDDYISMGTTLALSDTKANAKTNAPIFLDCDGSGSVIGPLEVKIDNTVRELYLGDKITNVYENNHTTFYQLDLDSNEVATISIDGHNFEPTELSVVLYPSNLSDADFTAVTTDYANGSSLITDGGGTGSR